MNWWCYEGPAARAYATVKAIMIPFYLLINFAEGKDTVFS